MELNNFNLYSKSVTQSSVDEVDEHITSLNLLNNYNEIVKYINQKFGKIEDRKLIEYPELNKQVEIIFKSDTVEFFAAKDWTQYYGKGWKKFIERKEK